MKSITDRYWNFPPNNSKTEKHQLLAKQLRVNIDIIRILENRGVTERDELNKYLYPSLKDLPNPFTMKDMREACRIIFEAILQEREIIIWGDYDVDGVTSTCLLLRFFNSINIHPLWFVPDRFEDGYGLDQKNLNKLLKKCERKKPVLITVDCGITNFNEVAEARKNGCRVIITDHHEPGENTVEADAILNVKQKECNFIDKNIAGVGTAFYLAAGLRGYLSEKNFFSNACPAPNLKEFLDLVAIGTVADMVPLENCNRVMVRAGFEVINTSTTPGIAALLEECDIFTKDITSDDIAFQIAPKLNAAGRLASAKFAVELLIEKEKSVARKLARKLTLLNEKRKKLCHDCLDVTLPIARNSLLNGDICIIDISYYSIGILGIVASQVVNKLKIPAIILAKIDDKNYGQVLKGSCRSLSGVDIFKVLSKCKQYLLKFGGHKMAAGITLYEKDLKDFKKAFSHNLKQEVANIALVKEYIDIELDVEKSLSSEFISDLKLLEPYGVGNSRPIFINRNSMLVDMKRIGKNGDHLSFRKRGRFQNHNCIAFNFGELESSMKKQPQFDMIYSVLISRYKRSVKWQASLVDLF